MTEKRRTEGGGFSRREFTRLLATGSSAALFAAPAFAWRNVPPLPPPSGPPTESFWAEVRGQFLMPQDLAVLNAANLCPSSAPVLEALYANTRDVDRDPSMPNRRKLGEGREAARRVLAEYLRVTPEEILITRNTSEGNNLVSSGVDLKAGDELSIFSDNHPSLHNAWTEKAKRFGFAVQVVDQVNPHPGAEYYVEAFARRMTSRTRVVAFTHLTSTVGDLLPATEICRLARERGVLSVVDGAQSFGLLDVDLSAMQPDFFTGSGHKWPCGPRETGVLYINKSAQTKIWPSIVSLYPGAVGISRTFEGFGQRDEPAIIAFGEALKLQMKIGLPAIEARGGELAQALMDDLKRMSGVKIWTDTDPARSAAIVSFQPGTLDPAKLAAALYDKDRVACMARGGKDRPGLRLSPHMYNTRDEMERTLSAIKRYMASGV